MDALPPAPCLRLLGHLCPCNRIADAAARDLQSAGNGQQQMQGVLRSLLRRELQVAAAPSETRRALPRRKHISLASRTVLQLQLQHAGLGAGLGAPLAGCGRLVQARSRHGCKQPYPPRTLPVDRDLKRHSGHQPAMHARTELAHRSGYETSSVDRSCQASADADCANSSAHWPSLVPLLERALSRIRCQTYALQAVRGCVTLAGSSAQPS